MTSITLTEILELVDRGERIPVPRGRCAVCLASIRLRADGTIGGHYHWLYRCSGAGHPPTSLDDPNPPE